MRWRVVVACLLAAVATVLPARGTAAAPVSPLPRLCAAGEEPATGAAYYAIELVNTGRVAGAQQAVGMATAAFAPSPFGLALGPAGEYVTRLEVRLRSLPLTPRAVYAVWVATPQLDSIQLLGLLDETLSVDGEVQWNKYVVVVTREDSAEGLGERWAGPVVLRGMSRSGRMHTMAGHGAFQAEPCAKYGY